MEKIIILTFHTKCSKFDIRVTKKDDGFVSLGILSEGLWNVKACLPLRPAAPGFRNSTRRGHSSQGCCQKNERSTVFTRTGGSAGTHTQSDSCKQTIKQH